MGIMHYNHSICNYPPPEKNKAEATFTDRLFLWVFTWVLAFEGEHAKVFADLFLKQVPLPTILRPLVLKHTLRRERSQPATFALYQYQWQNPMNLAKTSHIIISIPICILYPHMYHLLLLLLELTH